MRKVLKRFVYLWIALILSACASWAQDKREFFQGRQVAAHEVLLKFRPPVFLTKVIQAEQAGDVDWAEEVGGAGVILFHSRSKDTATLVRELSADGDVEYVEPNFIVYADAIPNDPSFGELWGLRNTGQTILGVAGTPGADISAVPAWDVSTGSRANVVAVIDTGIDYNHPDLAANVWSAPTAFTVTVGGRSITCAAGTHGFNAITNSCDPMDDNSHGTHVSGTIGAVGNNGVGVVGVNWTASIMAAKFLNAGGSGSTSDAINCIEFVIKAKAFFGAGANVRVLSNSWGGGDFSQALLDQINLANTNGMLFVAAAGNDSTNTDIEPHYPSSYNAPNVVSVAATDNNDMLASFSNYGPTTVHLGAPGVNTLSTVLSGLYGYKSGTSMATPHVSGAAALVLAKCTSLTTANLKSNLLNNVDPIASLADLTITGGRLDVNKAIRTCDAPAMPNFFLPVSPPSQTVAPGASPSYTVTVIPSGGFTGSVALTVSGLPAGASGSFNPASVTTSGSSTLTVSTSTTTPAGSFPLTITGTSGSLTRTRTVTLVVAVAGPDFSVSASPPTATVTAGASTSYTVTVTPSGGFTGTVTFSLTGLPAGAGGSFNPTSVTTSGSSTLTVSTSTTTPGGTFQLTITGTSGSLSRTTVVSLVVVVPDFSLLASPASQTVAAGGSTSYTITVTPSGGFMGTVSLSCSGAPVAANCTISPASVMLTGTNPETAAVTVTTTARSILAPSPKLRTPTKPISLPWPILLAMLVMLGVLAAKGRQAKFALGIASLVVLLCVGCGGGTTQPASPTPTTGPPGGTPAGASLIQFTGTSGSITRTTTVSLTVS